MFQRTTTQSVTSALGRQAAVGLIGPRQVGKTTLALEIGGRSPSIYLDLQNPTDRAKLAEPRLYLAGHADKLVILDEIHQLPELFPVLRGLIDEGRRGGNGIGRFLILGSASVDLLRQSGETLAGRIAYVELPPLEVTEVAGQKTADELWLRGGFPGSLLAANDGASFAWRLDFIRTYLERDVPMFGPRVAAETLRRLWTMLAHQQGGLLNSSELARSLGVSTTTVSRYLDLLVDLLLLRRLQPAATNGMKRLVKSPKVYVRDSGITHALLGIRTQEDLAGHPVSGASWEGFVIEQLLAALPQGGDAAFYRTAAGAEMDLILTMPGGERWAVEVKRSSAPKLGRGGHSAIEDLEPSRVFVVYAGTERFPLSDRVEAIGVAELVGLVRNEWRRAD